LTRADDEYKAGVHTVESNSQPTGNPLSISNTRWKTSESTLARDRTNEAMVGAEAFPHRTLICDYDWETPGDGATIVDAGGEFGGATIEFCGRFPKIQIILHMSLKLPHR
jgi:hypothetical protein